ncbi:MAG: NosD domain-containing protein [Candidatus Woesearchaeota archaeon]
MKKRLMLLILSVILVLSVSIVYAECIIPKDGFILTSSAVFCESEYVIENGIAIKADGITLDCNNAVLKGKNNEGNGISLESRKNVIIKNCIIQDYYNGIYLEESSNNNIRNNEFLKNNNGIVLDNSQQNNIENNKDTSIESAVVYYDDESTDVDNEQNFADINEIKDDIELSEDDNEEKEILEKNDQTKEDIQELLDISNSVDKVIDKKFKEVSADHESVLEESDIYNENEKKEYAAIEEKIINNINVIDEIVPIRKKDHLKAAVKVEIEKTRTIYPNKGDNGKTYYETKITAKEDIKGLVVFEYFPKELARHVREVNFETNHMILIEEDPIVKKEVGDMNKGDVVIISYSLDKIVDGSAVNELDKGNLNPSSVVSIENSSKLINALANVSYILALYFVLIVLKRIKAKEIVNKIKHTIKNILGVSFPVGYIILSLIPKINYRLIISEMAAIIVYSAVIVVLLGIIFLLLHYKRKK